MPLSLLKLLSHRLSDLRHPGGITLSRQEFTTAVDRHLEFRGGGGQQSTGGRQSYPDISTSCLPHPSLHWVDRSPQHIPHNLKSCGPSYKRANERHSSANVVANHAAAGQHQHHCLVEPWGSFLDLPIVAVQIAHEHFCKTSATVHR